MVRKRKTQDKGETKVEIIVVMEIPCIVDKIIYTNGSGFAILACQLNALSSKYNTNIEDILKKKIKPNKYGNFTVTVGMFEDENIEGQQVIFDGEFTTHPKFGDQFKAGFYYLEIPETEDGLQMFLCQLPNIKESRSRAIIEKWGVEGTIDVLDNHPEDLIEISGITEKRIPPIIKEWKKKKVLRDLFDFLTSHNVSPKIAQKIYDEYGEKSKEILEEDPYRITEIKGIGFLTADEIAFKVLKDLPQSKRLKACIQHILTENVYKNSNLCMLWKSLKEECLRLLKESNEKIDRKESLKDYVSLFPICIKENLDLFVGVKDIEGKNGAYIYLKEIWDKEKYIAGKLYHRSQHNERKEDCFECNDDNIKEAEEDVSKFSDREITLDDTQKEAIKSAFKDKITVINGGAGTGKSTICRCIYHLATEHNLTIRLMSPTGKASQVLSDKTGCAAATIHRSLRMKPGDETPREIIEEDIIIVDEISMVGVDTLYAILKAMEQNLWCNIVLVGDANQLASVSPGNFLSDIIQSGCANIITLDKIHRQDENSYISLLANEISLGKVVDVPEDANDIKWHDIDSSQFEHKIKKVIQNYLNQGNNIDDLQILSPIYKGDCGVNKINEVVQILMAEVNGTSDHCYHKGFVKFYVKDRVMQTANNYQKQIFNGDIGKIVDLGKKVIDSSVNDKEEDFITVNFYGDEITFVGKEIEELKVAWCCTVHKYQGSQNKNIILVLVNEARRLMSKELVYTAMTRAEKYLSIYGHKDMFRSAPMRSAITKRYTNMVNLVKEMRENRKILKVLE